MNGVLLWFAGLLVVLLGALFAVPYAVDWNSYRGVFEEEASRMLGREVRVGGDVNLRLLPVPYVSFEKPRIADADIGEAFVRAESFTMWLALAPLVQGIIEAKQVELKRPALRLQIDRQGGGNWQQIRIKRGTLPFVPRGFALQSVKITDGVIGLHGVDGEELARIEIPEGEFTAPGLEGPYRFRADIKWDGIKRELRGSTAAPDPDGSVRLKTVVRVPGAGNSYTFDGTIRDLATKPRAEGDVTVAIARDPQAAPPASSAGGNQPPASENAFEVRARLAADTLGAKLGDIAFSFEQAGRPQLLTGTAEASWQEHRTFKANLSSRWLDLERISGAPAGSNAFDMARRLSLALIDLLPKQGEVSARIAVDQANFAGDSVSGLVVAVEDRGQGLKVKELRAALPGGVRVDFSGELDRGGLAEGLKGDLLLRGSSLSRLLTWAAHGSVPIPSGADTGFSLSSGLHLSRSGIELRQAALDAGAGRFTGDFSYKWGTRRALTLSIDSRRADISGILPGVLKAGLMRLMAEPDARQSSPSWPGLLSGIAANLDARIRVRADMLTDGTQVLNGVDADIALQDGTLSIPRLRAATVAGFNLDLSGELKELATQPRGALRGVVAAATQPAMKEMLDLAGIGAEATLGRSLARLTPMRLAFVASSGGASRKGAQISLDGMALGQPLAANMTLDGGWSGWRTAPVDAMLVADSAEVARLGYQLLSGDAMPSRPSDAVEEGRFLVKAVGTPSEKVATLVQLSVNDMQLDVRGQSSVPADLALRFEGHADVAIADAADAFTFAGLSRPAAAVGLGLHGKLGIAVTEAGAKLDANRFEVGDARVSGEISLAGPQAARTIDATLNTDDVSLPRLLAFVLDGSRRPPPEAEEALASHWREEPFDFSNLEHVRGRLALRTDALTLEEGFGLSAANLEANFEPGRITVTKLEGRALGGALSSAFKLEKVAAGASLSGVFGLWDIRLEQIVGAAEAPVAAGRAGLTVQFSGQAVTPRALVSVMTGKGELELKDARMERLSPAAVEATSEAVLTGRVEGTGEALQQSLRKSLAEAPLPLGNRKVPVTLGEGALRLGIFSVDTPAADVTNRTTIDLGELKIDTEWRFQPKAAVRGRQTSLPGISVVQVGPLVSFASLEPRIVSDALERELAVRQMERSVEQLERLRREDEARAKAEAERLKAVERERIQRMQTGPRIDVPFPLPATPAPQQSAPPQPVAPGVTAQPSATVIPKAEPIEITPLPAPRPAPRRPPSDSDAQWPPRW